MSNFVNSRKNGFQLGFTKGNIEHTRMVRHRSEQSSLHETLVDVKPLAGIETLEVNKAVLYYLD